jgi:hypothetical protein
MIEREATVKISCDLLGNLLGGTKTVGGRLVRVANEGFYEVTITLQGGSYTTLLPISSTAIIATRPEQEVPSIDVER